MSYLYEQLSPEKFQQFCQSLLTAAFPNIQCLPVAQPDGGRDALVWTTQQSDGPTPEFIAFQVKFSRNSERPTDKFIASIRDLELPKVEKLKGMGLKAYYLLTNVKGSAHLETRQQRLRQAQGKRPRRMAKQSALPPTLAPRLINREAAAAYASVSPNTFDEMVEEGTMPRPRLVKGRRIAWDVHQLDQAIDQLPVHGEDAVSENDGWDD